MHFLALENWVADFTLVDNSSFERSWELGHWFHRSREEQLTLTNTCAPLGTPPLVVTRALGLHPCFSCAVSSEFRTVAVAGYGTSSGYQGTSNQIVIFSMSCDTENGGHSWDDFGGEAVG